MTTELLYEFLILSKTLNYSAAAKNLFISQSVLSKHIKSLENELHTTLLLRDTHNVTLTASGHLLATEAEDILSQCNHAVNLVKLQEIPTTGDIKIACALELSYAAHIQVFTRNFMGKYPEINIAIEVHSNGTPEEMLNYADFVFTPCEYQNLPPHIYTHLLQVHGTYVALYPNHPLLSKPLLQIRELEGETIIVPFMNELFGPYAKNWQVLKHYNHEKINCIPAPNLSSALFLVSIGKGIAVIPRYAKNLLPNNLFTIGLSSPNCQFNEYLYYRSSEDNNAATLFYKEFLQTYIQNGALPDVSYPINRKINSV